MEILEGVERKVVRGGRERKEEIKETQIEKEE